MWQALSKAALPTANAAEARPPVHTSALRSLLRRRASIPDLGTINRWLDPTGWRAEYVEGYVGADIYQEMLSARIFPIARRIRKMRDLHHSAAPDFAHDVLGHLPMLFDRRYRELVETWARRVRMTSAERPDVVLAAATSSLIMAKEREARDQREIEACTAQLVEASKEAARVASRRYRYDTFFTWAIEYGILGNVSIYTIIGGACLSSPGEMRRVTGGLVDLKRFAGAAVGYPVDYTVYQPVMFVADGYDELFECLEDI